MRCNYCGGKTKFLTSREFYGRDYGTNLYLCEPCDAYVGTVGNSTKPLGTLANKALRTLRMRCHLIFDKQWKSGKKTRTQCYQWLAEYMNISSDKAHIGMFDEEQCKKLLAHFKR